MLCISLGEIVRGCVHRGQRIWALYLYSDLRRKVSDCNLRGMSSVSHSDVVLVENLEWRRFKGRCIEAVANLSSLPSGNATLDLSAVTISDEPTPFTFGSSKARGWNNLTKRSVKNNESTPYLVFPVRELSASKLPCSAASTWCRRS